MKIVICDDDPLWSEHASTVIKKYGNEHGLSLEVSAVADMEALFFCKGESPDVAFVDIRLETGDGITVARKINDSWKNCQIVYLTNYLFYATEVYQTEHAYFVLKKEFPGRINEIFAKILHKYRQRKAKLCFQIIGGNKRIFSLFEIQYFERKMRRTYIHTTNGKFAVWESIEQIGELLLEEDFVRCHNSFVVCLSAILEMREKDFVLSDGTMIPISRTYLKKTKDAFARWALRQMS